MKCYTHQAFPVLNLSGSWKDGPSVRTALPRPAGVSQQREERTDQQQITERWQTHHTGIGVCGE